ncbi:MAG: Hpt domain-containing protein [Thermoanaerobaculia bacterium]
MNAPPEAFPPAYTTATELLAAFDGDREFVKELILVFLSRCPILLDEIRAGLAADDAPAVSQAAHSLKGSLSYFESGGIHALAQKIEETTAADLPAVPALLRILEERIAELTRHLSEEMFR